MKMKRVSRMIAPYLEWRATKPDWSFSRDLFSRMKLEKCEIAEITR